MRYKLLQIGSFYIRFDLTIIDRFNILLGLNYLEGMYVACIDESLQDCKEFEYVEVQVGLLFFTLAFGI
jgi:hypothetical protein